MFQRVAATDTKLIISGLIILLTIVTVGVGIVEHQLATLTQRPAQERLFYIGRNEKPSSYLVHVFGYGITFDNIFPQTAISLTDNNLVITIVHRSIKIPINARLQVKHWFGIWHQQFVNEALLAKKTAGEYWRQTKPYVEAAFQKLKLKIQEAIDKTEEHIREYR